MAELSNVPMAELLQEALRRRDEMLNGDGTLKNKPFALADFLGTRICVDGVPAQRNENGEVELMAITRGTGRYAGKLCLIGGGVGRIKEGEEWVPESVEEALRRHFRTDLGYEIEPFASWHEPQYLAQDMRPIDGEIRDGFMPNPASRHLIASRFLVQVTNGDQAPVFGSTALGGQEALGVTWFTEAAMPEPEAFGYNHGHTYQAMFPIAERLVP